MTLTREAALEILGLPSDSSFDDAIIRYKKLALKWFPDLHNNSEIAIEEFKNVNEAIIVIYHGDKPLETSMKLTEMFSLFQSIFFGDDISFDDDDEYETIDSYEDDYNSDCTETMGGDSTMSNEMQSQALQNAEELIMEEELEKKKAERRRAKKKRRKERKRQQKVAEENTKTNEKKNFEKNPGSHKSTMMSDSETSGTEEDIDTASAFVAVITKKKKRIPICEPKQKEEKKHSLNKSESEKVLDDNTSRVLRSRQLAIRGNEMANTGHFLKAAELFSESIKLDPSDHRFYGNRSYCFDRSGQYEKALKDAERSIALCPNWPKGYYRKGRAYMGLRKYAQAEECFVQVLKLDMDCDDAVKELQKVKIVQLTEMGYSREQAETAIARHGTVQEALNALLSNTVTITPMKDQIDIFISDDESDDFFSSVVNPTPSEAYDIKMDPNNPEGHNSLWIGNVQPDVTEKKLTTLFQKYGELISIKVMPEKFCAFINFKNKVSPGKAMKAYQGYALQGANLVIRFPNLPGQTTTIVKKPKPKTSTQDASNSKTYAPVNGDECYFWRTTGCIYGDNCRFKHIRANRGVDKKPYMQ